MPVQSTKVYYFISTDHRNPVKDFIDSLPLQSKSKIFRIFQSIEDYGLSSVLPHLKKLTGTPLWEIRILGRDSIRIIYIAPNQQSILVLHGFIKKNQKTPTKELTIALKRYHQQFGK